MIVNLKAQTIRKSIFKYIYKKMLMAFWQGSIHKLNITVTIRGGFKETE